jgi:hypothetical protein
VYTAFPHAAQARNLIHSHLKAVQRLRNRISHHERILTSRRRFNTGDTFLSLIAVLQCVGWVCPETAAWLATRFRYTAAQNILDDVAAFGVLL